MKLYTHLSAGMVHAALKFAKDKGRVTPDILFVVFDSGTTRFKEDSEQAKLYPYRHEIRLATDDKTTGPKKSRYHTNTGQYGGGYEYAATYDEWGWFMTEVFELDENAAFGQIKPGVGGYQGKRDFHVKTGHSFLI